MDIQRHNRDLLILQREAPRPRFGKSPGWARVDWIPTVHGGNIIMLEAMVLPDVCSPDQTDVKIEAPPSLYEPASSGRTHFYRNIWITPDLRVWNRQKRCWQPIPRLHEPRQGSRFAYLCIHPGFASGDSNILDFLKVLELHFLNPGLHATAGEEL